MVHVEPARFRFRWRRLVLAFGLVLAVGLGSWRGAIAQLDPAVRNQIVQAAVQVGVVLQNASGDRTWFPIGSGVVVAPTGLILTNQHVIDTDKIAAEFAVQQARDPSAAAYSLVSGEFLIAISDGRRPPDARFIATVAASDPRLDLAVLQVQRDDRETPVDPATLNLPFTPPGNSDTVDIGEPLHVFGFPAIGNESLTYTTGVASGFLYEEGIDGPAWINTDALMSGGNSGGPVMDHTGALIGIATSGTPLDCRPGDVNDDGKIDALDVGCVPTGGSLGQVRPINLALPLLRQVDPTIGGGAADSATGAVQTAATSAPRLLDPLAGSPTPPAVTNELATGQACAARGDWRCAVQYLTAARATDPDNPGLRDQLVDAYLGLGGLEEDAAQLVAARHAYEEALTLDPTRPEATNALNRLSPYTRMVFADGFSGQQRYATADSDSSSADYGDGVLSMTVSRAGLISTFPLAAAPDGDYALTLTVAGASGNGGIGLELDGDESWLFLVDPAAATWSLLHTDAASDQFIPWVQPIGFAELAGTPVQTIELRVVARAPSLLINGIDVAALQGVPLPAMPAGGQLRFGASLPPDGAEPFTVSFDRAAIYQLP